MGEVSKSKTQSDEKVRQAKREYYERNRERLKAQALARYHSLTEAEKAKISKKLSKKLTRRYREDPEYRERVRGRSRERYRKMMSEATEAEKAEMRRRNRERYHLRKQKQ